MKRWINPLRYFASIQNLRRVVNSELLQVTIEAGTTKTKFQLPDAQNLRNVKLMGIVAYAQEDIPFSVLDGSAVQSIGNMQRCFLTLQGYNGDNFSWNMPVLALRNLGNIVNFQQTSPRVFNNQRVNWPKSYVEFSDISGFPATEIVVLFEVFYIETTGKQKSQKKATFRNRS